jgi:hypothetical protein
VPTPPWVQVTLVSEETVEIYICPSDRATASGRRYLGLLTGTLAKFAADRRPELMMPTEVDEASKPYVANAGPNRQLREAKSNLCCYIHNCSAWMRH